MLVQKSLRKVPVALSLTVLSKFYFSAIKKMLAFSWKRKERVPISRRAESKDTFHLASLLSQSSFLYKCASGCVGWVGG